MAGSGLNLALAPAKSDHLEAGLKWRESPSGWRASVALFRGGHRGRDRRGHQRRRALDLPQCRGGRAARGAELQAAREWGSLGVTISASTLEGGVRRAFARQRFPGVPQRTGYLDLRGVPHPRLDLGFEARHSAEALRE
jgi:hypothetical protein